MKKEIIITLKDWDYTCGDGCCHMYGTEVYLNGKQCGNEYVGSSVSSALEAVLSELGYKVEINQE